MSIYSLSNNNEITNFSENGIHKVNSSSTINSISNKDDSSRNNSRKKRLLRKAPDAPKRFKSAYICYVIEKMDEVKKNMSEDLKVTDAMKVLANMWKNLDPEIKSHYQTIAENDKSRYFAEMKDYRGPMHVPNKRLKKPPGAPKRAMSAFLSFSQQMRPEVRAQYPELKNTDISGVLANLWRTCSDEVKKPHIDRERIEREKYHEDMGKWKVEFQAKGEAETLDRLGRHYDADEFFQNVWTENSSCNSPNELMDENWNDVDSIFGEDFEFRTNMDQSDMKSLMKPDMDKKGGGRHHLRYKTSNSSSSSSTNPMFSPSALSTTSSQSLKRGADSVDSIFSSRSNENPNVSKFSQMSTIENNDPLDQSKIHNNKRNKTVKYDSSNNKKISGLTGDKSSNQIVNLNQLKSNDSTRNFPKASMDSLQFQRNKLNASSLQQMASSTNYPNIVPSIPPLSHLTDKFPGVFEGQNSTPLQRANLQSKTQMMKNSLSNMQNNYPSHNAPPVPPSPSYNSSTSSIAPNTNAFDANRLQQPAFNHQEFLYYKQYHHMHQQYLMRIGKERQTVEFPQPSFFSKAEFYKQHSVQQAIYQKLHQDNVQKPNVDFIPSSISNNDPSVSDGTNKIN